MVPVIFIVSIFQKSSEIVDFRGFFYVKSSNFGCGQKQLFSVSGTAYFIDYSGAEFALPRLLRHFVANGENWNCAGNYRFTRRRLAFAAKGGGLYIDKPT